MFEVGTEYGYRIRKEPNGLPFSLTNLLVIKPTAPGDNLDIWMKPSGDSCATRLNWATSSVLPAKKPALNYIIETGECHLEPGAKIHHLSEVWGTDQAMPIQWGFSTFDTGAIYTAMELVPTPSMQSPTFRFIYTMDSIDFGMNPADNFAVGRSAFLPPCEESNRGWLTILPAKPNMAGDTVWVCLKKADAPYGWVAVAAP